MKLNRQGMTIFLTTHYMEEADLLAQRLCIVDQGKIVAEGTSSELKAQVGTDKLTLHFRADDIADCEKARALVANISGVEGGW